jgi:chromosome segregation ATPase
MASHKRKQAEVSTENSGPAVVIVGDNNNNNNNPISSLKSKLRAIATTLTQQDDPILSAIKTPAEDSEQNHLLQEALDIRSQLHDQIEQAKFECQHESDVLSSLSSRLDSMKKKSQSLASEMKDLASMQVNMQRQIALHQEEASQEIESIDQVEEERKRQVPRLKSQISLYAATTLIKWDYACEDVLSGQVVSNRKLNDFWNMHPKVCVDTCSHHRFISLSTGESQAAWSQILLY